MAILKKLFLFTVKAIIFEVTSPVNVLKELLSIATASRDCYEYNSVQGVESCFVYALGCSQAVTLFQNCILYFSII